MVRTIMARTTMASTTIASRTMAMKTMARYTMASTTMASTTMNNGKAKNVTFRGVGLSADVRELEGVEGSTTVPVLDGVKGSTTVAVLDGVEGSTTVAVLDGVECMTYRTGKSTTKSTMRHKSTKVLPNPIMCEVDLRHLQIHPEPGIESSYRRNRGREEGEGTPAKAAAELLVTAAAELLLFAAAQDPAMASDLRRGRARFGGNGGSEFRL
jgi:hypothetical protein